jgi:hypothetical protein
MSDALKAFRVTRRAEKRRIIMDRHNATEKLLRQLQRAKESAGPLERLLLQSEAELQDAPQMETLERFVVDMAVYFGNVFDAVTSYGNILQMRMDQDDPLRTTHAQVILDDARAGKRLTNRLLRTRGTVRLRLLTLDHFMRGLAPLLSRIVAKRIELRTVLARPA